MDDRIVSERRFLLPLRGQAISPPPIWLMRQAGRYLPEYREVRAKAGSFLNLCYSPELAAEVTLQPIRRYGFDASILFADILIVPDALGQKVAFVEGEGPKLDPIRSVAGLKCLDRSKAETKYKIIAETVARLRQDLPNETALIGFCGAPWTVATYMVEGAGSKDQAAARLWAYQDRDGFQQLIDLLVDASVDYLSLQVEAGADALQIFDSWAGSLPENEFNQWVVEPTRKIRAALKARFPNVPVIGFARGSGVQNLAYGQRSGVDALSCETEMPLSFMRETLAGAGMPVQGNLDPLLLVSGGAALEARVREIVETMRGVPFIFNLGHGIVPQTPPENVGKLVSLVRELG
jgi:uroporphyrinogen decarboxylase